MWPILKSLSMKPLSIIMVKAKRGLKWHYVRDLTHVSFFMLKTMKIIGEKLGLDIIYSDHHRYTTFKRSNSGQI